MRNTRDTPLIINPYKIPCKECLKLPICIGQSQLSCDDVHDYFNSVLDHIKREMGIANNKSAVELALRNEAWDKAWDTMRYDLPNIKGLFRGEKDQKMPNTSDPNYIPTYVHRDPRCRR